MSDTPLTDAAEDRDRDERDEIVIEELSKLSRKLERQLAAIRKLQVVVISYHSRDPKDREFRIGTVGGGERMLAGTRYVRADDLRAALKG